MHFAKFSAVFSILCTLLLLSSCATTDPYQTQFQPTISDQNRYIVTDRELVGGRYHTRHRELFGNKVRGFNLVVLEAIDAIQGSVEEGGGFFSDVTADPQASPVHYGLTLFQNQLYTPKRATSFDTGATYAALIETFNRLYDTNFSYLDPTRAEAMRILDAEGKLKLPGNGFWGHWNTREYGSHLAMVQYSGIGIDVPSQEARPGDFVNIAWRDGGSTSAIFLGYYIDRTSQRRMVFWSSQDLTDGYGDYIVPVSWIRSARFVRLVNPEALFSFDPRRLVDTRVRPQRIEW